MFSLIGAIICGQHFNSVLSNQFKLEACERPHEREYESVEILNFDYKSKQKSKQEVYLRLISLLNVGDSWSAGMLAMLRKKLFPSRRSLIACSSSFCI